MKARMARVPPVMMVVLGICVVVFTLFILLNPSERLVMDGPQPEAKSPPGEVTDRVRGKGVNESLAEGRVSVRERRPEVADNAAGSVEGPGQDLSDAKIVGVVFECSGRRIAGASIEYWRINPTNPEDAPGMGRVAPLPPDGRTLSDSHGRFELPAELGRVYSLCAKMSGMADGMVPSCSGGDRVTIVLQAVATIQGSVRLSNGLPLPSAMIATIYSTGIHGVFVSGPSTESNAGGVYRFDGVEPGYYFLNVRGLDLVHAQDAPLQVLSGSNTQYDIKLQPSVPVRVRVRAAIDGAPISGARVSGIGLFPVMTDLEGIARFGVESLEEDRQVFVRAEGYVRSQGTLMRGSLGWECEIVLARGAAVRGRVVDSGRAGIGGVTVTIGTRSRMVASWSCARSSSDGAFCVSTVPTAVPLTIQCVAEGYGTRLENLSALALDADSVEVGDVALDRRCIVVDRCPVSLDTRLGPAAPVR